MPLMPSSVVFMFYAFPLCAHILRPSPPIFAVTVSVIEVFTACPGGYNGQLMEVAFMQQIALSKFTGASVVCELAAPKGTACVCVLLLHINPT